MPKQLAKPVYAGGQWWDAGAEPPQEVAETIRNPKAWAFGVEADDVEQASGPARHSGDGPRLAGPVNVGGVWYGPDDEVPAEVAARIRNPKAWVDGVMPDTSATEGQRGGSTGSTGGADTAPDGGSDDDAPDAASSSPSAPERSPNPRSSRSPARATRSGGEQPKK